VRVICAYSGKRGGYGAFVPLMRAVEDDRELELLILLGDQHASPEFGRTVDEARRAFPDSDLELIEMGTGRGDTELVRAENLGACLAEAARILDRTRPDVVLVHGDRGDHMMVAFAALNLGIPVAHSQGGDRSGNIDEVQRHAITKLAHLHFPETEAAAERIRKLGEDPWRIHVVGSTYVDRIVNEVYAPPAEARASIGLGDDERYVLVIVHPDTYLSRDENHALAAATFEAVKISGRRGVVTYPVSDPGYEGVLAALAEVERDPQLIVRQNFDNDVYLGLMAGAEALVGNSSSALVEAPYFRLPAVDVGERQRGRDHDPNVLHADPDSVGEVLARALDPSFRESLKVTGRLGDGHAGERIVEVLKSVSLDERLLRKELAY
jgi:GDP/UDP-N,N'-diacetylbacillosamine 2-epimerase (hydrolysing)